MDSPLSSIIVDLVLQDLELKIDYLSKILEAFNSFHDKLQFTLEISGNNCIDFLDVTILLDDQRNIFDRYDKPTNSGRYMNFYSQHPLPQKRSTVFGLDKTLFLSHPKCHKKEFGACD